MKDFFKNLIFEKEATKPDAQKPIKPQLSNQDNNGAAGEPKQFHAPTSYMSSPGVVNDDVKAHFYDVIKESNLAGADYYEYAQTLKILAPSLPIESVRYLTAFSTLQIQGLTKPYLIETAEKYKSIISVSLKEFEGEYAKMLVQQVEEPRKIVQQKSQEMQELTKKMQEISSEIQRLSSEANTAELELKIQRERFITAGNAVIGEISTEIEKINSFIQ